MRGFFQRISEGHSGARKTTNDSSPTYQVWLPPASKTNDERTLHRANQEPIDATLSGHRTGEKRSSSRAPRVRDPSYEPHSMPPEYNHATYPSTGKGSHKAAHSRTTATTMLPPQSYPVPKYPENSVGWSTSQYSRPSEIRNQPFQQASTTRTDDSARHVRHPDGKFGSSTREREKENRSSENDPNSAQLKDERRYLEDFDQVRYKGKDRERGRIWEAERKDLYGHGREAKDEARYDMEREWERGKDRDRKEREKGRDGEWVREREGERRHRERVREHERQRERGREREGERESQKDRHARRYATREQSQEIFNGERREEGRRDDGRYRERNAPDRKGRTTGRDDNRRKLTKEYEDDLEALGPPKENFAASRLPEVYRDLQDEKNLHSNSRRRQEQDRDGNTEQYRRHEAAPRQRDSSVDVRKDRHNYLDKRYEPERTAWGSAAISQPHPHVRHRHLPANDETTSDSSPRKQLPKLSKHKRNLTDAEAVNPPVMSQMNTRKRRDSVPSAPSDPALAHLRQPTFASNSKENQAKNVKTTLEHLGNTSTEQLSRQGLPSTTITPREFDVPTRKDYVQTNSKPFNPQQSAETSVPTMSKVNEYEQPTKGLSFQRLFNQERLSSHKPSTHLVENVATLERNTQTVEKHPDIHVAVTATKYSSASQQAALREARNTRHVLNNGLPSRTTENRHKDLQDESLQKDLRENRTPAHHEEYLQAQTPLLPSASPYIGTIAPFTRTLDTQEPRPYEAGILPAASYSSTQPRRPTALSANQHLQISERISQVPFVHVASRVPSNPPVVEDLSRKRTESSASRHRALTGQEDDTYDTTSKATVLLDHSSRPAALERMLQPTGFKAPEGMDGVASLFMGGGAHVGLKEGPPPRQSAAQAILLPQHPPHHHIGSESASNFFRAAPFATNSATEHNPPSVAPQGSDRKRQPVRPTVSLATSGVAFESSQSHPSSNDALHMTPNYANLAPPQLDQALSFSVPTPNGRSLEFEVVGEKQVKGEHGLADVHTQGISVDTAFQSQAYPSRRPSEDLPNGAFKDARTSSLPLQPSSATTESASRSQRPPIPESFPHVPTMLPLERPPNATEGPAQSRPPSTYQIAPQQRTTGMVSTAYGDHTASQSHTRTMHGISTPLHKASSQSPLILTVPTSYPNQTVNDVQKHTSIPSEQAYAKTEPGLIIPSTPKAYLDVRLREHGESHHTGGLVHGNAVNSMHNNTRTASVEGSSHLDASVTVSSGLRDTGLSSAPLAADKEMTASDNTAADFVRVRDGMKSHNDQHKPFATPSDVPKQRPEYGVPLMSGQSRTEVGYHMPRSITAMGHRQTSGEHGSTRIDVGLATVHPTGVPGEFSTDNMKIAPTIKRPSTAMSSRYRSLDSHMTAAIAGPVNTSHFIGAGIIAPSIDGTSMAPKEPADTKASHHTEQAQTSILRAGPAEGAPPNNTSNESPHTSNALTEDRLHNRASVDDNQKQPPLRTSTAAPPATRIELPVIDKKGMVANMPPQTDIHATQRSKLSRTPATLDHDGTTGALRDQSRDPLQCLGVPGEHHSSIQNPRLAELLSNPFSTQAPVLRVNDSTAISTDISHTHQFIGLKPSPELPVFQSMQPEPPFLFPSDRRPSQKPSHEPGSRAVVAQSSTQTALEQSRSQQSHLPVSASMPTDDGHGYPQNNGLPVQSRMTHDNKDVVYLQKPPPAALAVSHSPVLLGSHQLVQSHTISRNHDPNETSHRQATGKGSPLTGVEATSNLPPNYNQQLPGTSRNQEHSMASHKPELVSSIHPPQATTGGLVAAVAHVPNQEQVSSQKASRKQNHVKRSQRPVPIAQSHSSPAPTHTTPAISIIPSLPSTQNHDNDKTYYKHAHNMPSSLATAPSATSRHNATIRRNEAARNRGQANGPINASSTSLMDPTSTHHVLTTSQVSQSRQPNNVSTPSHNHVPSSIDPVSISRTPLASTRFMAPHHTPESRPTPGTSNGQTSGSHIRSTVTANASGVRSDANYSNLIPTSGVAHSVFDREVSRKPSEDSVLLRTPSSLAPTALKLTESRTSLPASFSSQTSARRRGLFSIFKSKSSSQPPVQENETTKLTKQRGGGNDVRVKVGEDKNATTKAPIQVNKVASSRPTPPSISVPTQIQPIPDRKSPNKVFTPFRYLTSKRNRRVSAASLEAQDGTAPNTIIGSPTASMHSTQPPPIQLPSLRDVFTATQEWRQMEAAEVRELTGGKLRRARPGVVFDVAEDPTEEKRRKIKPQSRQA